MDKKLATKYLAFLAMTDGSLILHDGCKNASFSITMKASSFPFISTYAIPALEFFNIGYSMYESKDGKYKGVRSKVHPVLTTLHERIYVGGKQSPSAHDIKQLDWEAMAIMFMADGSAQKSGKRWYPMLNFCSFSYPELCWFKIQIKDRLGIDVNIYKCGKYFRYEVPSKDAETFFAGVAPFITDGFEYKLPYGMPQDNDSLGDEIVCSVGKPTVLAEMTKLSNT